MRYANGEGGSAALPVFVCLPLSATLGWLMCLCKDAPPLFCAACPPLGISVGVCFLYVCAGACSPLTSSFHAGLRVFVSCYSASFLSCCTPFPPYSRLINETLSYVRFHTSPLCLFLSLLYYIPALSLPPSLPPAFSLVLVSIPCCAPVSVITRL